MPRARRLPPRPAPECAKHQHVRSTCVPLDSDSFAGGESHLPALAGGENHLPALSPSVRGNPTAPQPSKARCHSESPLPWHPGRMTTAGDRRALLQEWKRPAPLGACSRRMRSATCPVDPAASRSDGFGCPRGYAHRGGPAGRQGQLPVSDRDGPRAPAAGYEGSRSTQRTSARERRSYARELALTRMIHRRRGGGRQQWRIRVDAPATR